MKRANAVLSIGIALVAAVAVHAQERVLTANVPFAFYASHTLMPQGTYRVDGNTNPTVAWIRSPEGDACQAVLTLGKISKGVEPAKLVFHRYGEDYFLAEIWPGTGNTGRVLPASRQEKETARNGAKPTLAVIRMVLQ